MKCVNLFVVTTLVVLNLLVACGGSEQPGANGSGDQVGTAVALTVAAIGAAGTAVSDLPPSPPTPLIATPTSAIGAENLPPTIPPPVTPATIQPDTPSCVAVSGLNVRSGPGMAYGPSLAAVGANTVLQPLGFSAAGYPGGQWLQVNVVGANQVGWVNADPQFVQCNVDYASLPAVSAPPTPTPLPPTATAAPVVAQPPDVDNVAVGGENFPSNHVFGEVIIDPTYLIRMVVKDSNFFAAEGDHDGAGIDHVEFFIADADGFAVYEHQENTAAYCIFAGGEPACNPWPANELGQYTWGQGGPLVESGEYQVNINVFSKAPEADLDFGGIWNWNFSMTVTVP